VSPQNLAAQELASGQVEQKPRANIYTMMLILAFVGICVACVLLWMELQAYGPYPWWKTQGVAPAATSWIGTPSDWLAAWEHVRHSMA
jgi:hypothetical protein